MSSPSAPIHIPRIAHPSLPKIKLSWPSSIITSERHEREVLPSLYAGSALLVRLVKEHGVKEGQELALSDDISECMFIALGLWLPGSAWGETIGGWHCLQVARNAARQANLLCIDKTSEMASRLVPWFITATDTFLSTHSKDAYAALERASVAALGPIALDEPDTDPKDKDTKGRGSRLHQLYLMALNAPHETGDVVDLINEDTLTLTLLSTDRLHREDPFHELLLSCVQDARRKSDLVACPRCQMPYSMRNHPECPGCGY